MPSLDASEGPSPPLAQGYYSLETFITWSVKIEWISDIPPMPFGPPSLPPVNVGDTLSVASIYL